MIDKWITTIQHLVDKNLPSETFNNNPLPLPFNQAHCRLDPWGRCPSTASCEKHIPYFHIPPQSKNDALDQNTLSKPTNPISDPHRGWGPEITTRM